MTLPSWPFCASDLSCFGDNASLCCTQADAQKQSRTLPIQRRGLDLRVHSSRSHHSSLHNKPPGTAGVYRAPTRTSSTSSSHETTQISPRRTPTSQISPRRTPTFDGGPAAGSSPRSFRESEPNNHQHAHSPREVKEHEGRLPNHDHHHHNHHHHHHHHQSLRNVRSPHHIDRHAPTPCLKDDDERNIEIRTVGGRTVSLAKMAYSKGCVRDEYKSDEGLNSTTRCKHDRIRAYCMTCMNEDDLILNDVLNKYNLRESGFGNSKKSIC